MNLNLPEVRIGKIRLREICEADFLDYYDIGKSPYTTKYLNWGPFNNPNEALWVIKEIFMKRPEAGLPVGYAIIYQGKMVGIIDFHTKYLDSNAAEIGYILHENFESLGIMHKCLKEMIQIGFYHLGFDKLICGACVENIKSLKVITDCGFKYEYETIAELNDGNHRAMYYTLYKGMELM